MSSIGGSFQLKHGRDVPFLYLDGTADAAIARLAFGCDLVCRRHPVERKAEVTQVLGCNFAKRRLCSETQAQQVLTKKILHENLLLKHWVEEVLERFSEAAVFGSRGIVRSLNINDPSRVGHFGALRGQNRWEDRDTVVIIGREQPSYREVEWRARAYAAAAGDAFNSGDYHKVARGIRTRGGVQSVDVMVHPDLWGDRVLRQIREAEIEQAIDRVRLIHNENPKHVYLLSPVVVDVTVDKVEAWRTFKKGGTRIEQAIEKHGVVYLSPTDCARYMPDIWSSKQLAATDLPTAKEMSKTPCRFIYEGGFDGKCPLLVEFSLKTSKGRSARKKSALVFAGEADVRTRLEALTGPLADFLIKDVT